MKKYTMINFVASFHQKYPKLANYLIFLLTFLFATFICWAVSGGSPRLHDILLLWVLWNCLWFKPIIFKIFSPLILLWVLYAPIGMQYGYPNAGMIASLFNTTAHEAQEFFDIKTVAYFLVIVLMSGFLYLIAKKVVAKPKQIKFFKYFSILLLVLFLANIVSVKDKMLKWRYSELLNIIPHTIEHYHYYLTTQETMKKLKALKNDWQIVSANPKYQNYVFVIGESASRQYLSPYGYPVDTSPFLRQVNGIKYTQMLSPAGHTIKSVPRLLTIPNEKDIEYQNNIFNLVDKLGFHTYWISNQDKMGEYENEVAYLASYAKENYYLSEKAPTTARYDYQMLPKIKEVINTKTDKPKLIVVHLIGSHTRFVKRVDFSKAHFDFKDRYFSDYLSSLLQTDMFLQAMYQDLKDSNQSFSMVYLSDHGLTPTTLKHGTTQFTLQVPLFKIASDDTTQQTNDNVISGFSFVWFLTEWLGIETDNQAKNTFLNSYQMNSLNDVKVFGDETIPYLSTEPFDGVLLKPTDDKLKDK